MVVAVVLLLPMRAITCFTGGDGVQRLCVIVVAATAVVHSRYVRDAVCSFHVISFIHIFISLFIHSLGSSVRCLGYTLTD